ncbi:hypothetical protein FQZ97_985800 [compost metagenome]
MGADAHGNQHFRLDGAMTVFCVLGRGIGLAIRVRIRQLSFLLFQRRQLFGGTPHDPHRLAAPLDHPFLARLQRGNIHLDRGACGLGPLRWLKTAHEGNGDRSCSHATHGAGCDQPGSAAAIDGRIDGCFTHGDLSISFEGTLGTTRHCTGAHETHFGLPSWLTEHCHKRCRARI